MGVGTLVIGKVRFLEGFIPGFLGLLTPDFAPKLLKVNVLR